jgi:hypothetical protein
VSKTKVFGVGGATGLAATAIAWAQMSLEPGEYELKSEIRVPGSAQAMNTTAKDCLSPTEARNFQDVMIERAEAESCKVSNLQMAADRITFDTVCEIGGSRTTASSDLTFGRDWYTAVVTTELNGDVTTSRVSAKRVAACSEE